MGWKSVTNDEQQYLVDEWRVCHFQNGNYRPFEGKSYCNSSLPQVVILSRLTSTLGFSFSHSQLSVMD
jgi:hypothetical protein